MRGDRAPGRGAGGGAEAGVDPVPFKFGVVGVTAGQTPRLNIANVALPPEPISPTCTAEESFRMSDGSLHGTPSRHTLAPGEGGIRGPDRW